ncbi:MAG: DNA-binding protein [Flavobacteriaceae bacterium]|nr:DNA-binding protein [Flavobacteriaceae bacterium]
MNFKVGDQVQLIIGRQTNLGFIVEINNSEEGLLYNSEIYVPIETGMETIGYIKKIREDGKLDVSLNKQGFLNVIERNCFIILNKLKQKNTVFLNDKSSPEDVIAQLNMSKKAFKKAIGVLYKQKKIIIDSDCITLKKNN